MSMAEDESKPPSDSEASEWEVRTRELLEKADALRGQRSDDELEDDLEQKLQAIEAQAKEARARQRARSQEKERRAGTDQETARGLGLGLSIAYAIIGMPMVGLALGWYLDDRFNANAWKPMLVMLGAVAGIGYAVYQLNRNERSSR